MPIRPTLILAASLLLLAGTFAALPGCPSGGGATSRGPANELTIAIQADGSTLDPHRATDAGSMRLIENLYSTLMRYASDFGEIEPDLLVDHDVNDDHTRFTLTIRDDAYFGQTGRNVTADDVAYSLERIRESGLRAEPLADLESIDVTGGHTLELHFAEPITPLLNYLAHPMYAIVDREVVEANDGELSRADAGSGPFRLVEWRRDQEAILERDERYYVDDRPRLERVIYRPIPEETSRVTALVNGEVDIILDVPAQQIGMIEGSDHIIIETTPGTFWEYVGLNTEVEPFNDPRVRRAIAWALDRDAINQAARFGYAHPLTGGNLPPGHWAHLDEAIYPQPDLDRARSLLADAGYENGFSAQVIVNTESARQVAAAGLIAQMLRPLDLDIEVRGIERATFFSRLNDRDFEMTVVGWVGLFDPDEWLYPIFHSAGAYNQQSYANPELDALLEQGRRYEDRDQRAEVYRRVQRIVAEDAPVVFLYLNDQITGMLDDVRDFDVHATATTTSLRDAWLDRGAE
ncbi:MAG: ABC transporter substrate-binding protein [Phycisphaeraceae bacterium]